MPTAGILTFAKGDQYARLAYLLHLSCKRLGVPVAVCVDAQEDVILDRLAVSGVMTVPYDSSILPSEGKYTFEGLAHKLTPFDLTIKTDADVVFPPETDFGTIWDRVDKYDLVPGVPYTFEHLPVSWSPYREKEDAEGLAQVYSTMFGFKKDSEIASDFYDCVFDKFREQPTLETDNVYSWAYSSVRKVTVDTPLHLHYHIPFHHCKAGTLAWPDTRDDWTNEVVAQVDKTGSIYVAGKKVVLPMHYVDKSFPEATDIAKVYLDVLHSIR
jgi:hypothetical protein